MYVCLLLLTSSVVKHLGSSTEEVGRNTRQRLLVLPELLSSTNASCMLYNRTEHYKSRLIYLLNVSIYYIFNCVNNKMLESDWFLEALIYGLR